jgi:hypothetical protein
MTDQKYLTVRELWLMSMAWNESPLQDDMITWLNSPNEDHVTVRQALAKAAPHEDDIDELKKRIKALEQRAHTGYALAFWLDQRPNIYLGVIGRDMVRETLENFND